MPELNWVGKDAVKNHDKEVPFKLLRKVREISVGEKSENLIIHGDNLEALKALMPFYKGRIKCIYIDPPYNTGNEGWIYNDKNNSPKIKKWLGKVVGGESEDLNRHDKWLCMMYPRLNLLKKLMANDGVMFVHIDEFEFASLKCLGDELFGSENFDALVWKKTANITNTKIINRIKTSHEYILIFYKDRKSVSFSKVKNRTNWNKEYSNPDGDKRGGYLPGIISLHEDRSRKNSANFYSVKLPSGRIITREWYMPKDEYERLVADNRIYFPKAGDGTPRVKIFQNDEQFQYCNSIIEDFGTFSDAKRELEDLLGENVFDTPKPRKLVSEMIRMSTKKDDLILDSFAGSGTTGHAVLDLNKEDDGNRRFIMVEMEDNVAKDITAKRINRAIAKYEYRDGFEYCELDKPLFDENGQIDKSCTFEQLATYIYFTETHTNIDKKALRNNFIGELGETEYYLLFREKGKNILDEKFLKELKQNEKKKIIYADSCLIDAETLEKYHIVFKQIPYEIERY